MGTATPLDIVLPRTALGEGPHWDPAADRLFWVDIVGQCFHMLDVNDGRVRSYDTSRAVSFVLPVSSTQVLLGLSNGVYLRDLDTDMEQLIAHVTLPNAHRLNDGKCDPQGRLWIGTINTSEEPSETAALYRIKDGKFREIDGGYANANGKAWSPDGRLLYHADTARGIIWQFDYDADCAELSAKRVFANLGDESPDGLAVDTDGNVYAALFGSSAVVVLTPRGDEVSRIDLPVPNPTSCAFGGPDMRTLFITTASDGMDDEALRQWPLAGHIFSVDLDVSGITSAPPSGVFPELEVQT